MSDDSDNDEPKRARSDEDEDMDGEIRSQLFFSFSHSGEYFGFKYIFLLCIKTLFCSSSYTGRLSLIRQLWDREGAGLSIFPDY